MRNRKSPRLPGYDYTLPGGYFITINTKGGARFFGDIENGVIEHTATGRIAAACWQEIPTHHAHATIDAYIVMPNHVHGILWLDEDATLNNTALGIIVATYKSAVTRAVRQVRCHEGPLWHGRYHDHIIRTNESLERIRAYIAENPARWSEDKFYAE